MITPIMIFGTLTEEEIKKILNDPISSFEKSDTTAPVVGLLKVQQGQNQKKVTIQDKKETITKKTDQQFKNKTPSLKKGVDELLSEEPIKVKNSFIENKKAQFKEKKTEKGEKDPLLQKTITGSKRTIAEIRVMKQFSDFLNIQASQANVGCYDTDHEYSLLKTATQYLEERRNPTISAINVVVIGKNLISYDNRRLVALWSLAKAVEMLVQYRKLEDTKMLSIENQEKYQGKKDTKSNPEWKKLCEKTEDDQKQVNAIGVTKRTFGKECLSVNDLACLIFQKIKFTPMPEDFSAIEIPICIHQQTDAIGDKLGTTWGERVQIRVEENLTTDQKWSGQGFNSDGVCIRPAARPKN